MSPGRSSLDKGSRRALIPAAAAVVIATLATAIAAWPAAAADTVRHAPGDTSVAGYPVSLGGMELFRIRVGNKGATAAERAAASRAS
jgi:hypothetical protein